jgi:hypothetical protein
VEVNRATAIGLKGRTRRDDTGRMARQQEQLVALEGGQTTGEEVAGLRGEVARLRDELEAQRATIAALHAQLAVVNRQLDSAVRQPSARGPLRRKRG